MQCVKSIFLVSVCTTLLLVVCVPQFAAGQSDTLKLAVTPPLFQLSVAPGDIWQSSVKVVNSNPHDLTVYAEVVNFAAQGERGYGKFIPLFGEGGENKTLAEWIEISEGPHVIAPEESRDVSFFVDVPEDASPGGHFAAILISTQPPGDSEDELVVQTSQAVTSLFFVRIAGDVVEAGDIREFSVSDTFLPEPHAQFTLRFENKGNVHIQPQGDIKITNMWGTERGVIPINQRSRFGNVLPESIREFNFSWKGEGALTEIGRYKAVATLTFGENQKQNVHAITYFWVVPVKATLITLSALAVIIFLIVWMIRAYIRRMLALAGVDVASMEHVGTQHTLRDTADDVHVTSFDTITRPLRIGTLDLKRRLRDVREFFDVLKTLGNFVVTYHIFFISLTVLIASFVAIVLYITSATTEERSYEITIDRGGESEVVDSEQVLKEALQSEEAPINSDQSFTLELVNASGEPGTAAEAAIEIEQLGYRVDTVRTDFSGTRQRTVVVYNDSFTAEAQALSSTLNGALLSARASSTDETSDIQVYIGVDRAVER